MKKTLSILLAAVLLLSLTACGEKTENDPASNSVSVSPVPEASSSAPETSSSALETSSSMPETSSTPTPETSPASSSALESSTPPKSTMTTS